MQPVPERSCSSHSIRASTEADVLFMAQHLRTADETELRTASSGAEPLETLLEGYRLSDPCLVAAAPDGLPCVLFGAVPSGKWGRVWLVATREIEHRSNTFLRNSKKWVRFFSLLYPVLFNVVDSRNILHLAWLRWAGFELTTSPPVQINGVPFHLLMKGGTSDV